MLQVFVTDKRKSKLYGGREPFNRIKKALVKEVDTTSITCTPHPTSRSSLSPLCGTCAHVTQP